MADLNPLSAANIALNNALAGLVGRDTDSDDAARSGPNFTDVMMARVTARQNAADELADIQKDYSDKGDLKPEWVDQLQYAKAADKTADKTVDKPVARDERNARVGAPSDNAVRAVREKPTIEKADTDASVDEPSVKGMKKLANTLLQAEKDGKLALPPAVKAVLEKIAASDGTAAQIAPLMQDMIGALRKLEAGTGADALKASAGDMTWPAEIASLFQNLQVNPGVKAGQPVTLDKIVKALRMMAHLVQQAASQAAEKAAANPAMLLPMVRPGKQTTADEAIVGTDKTRTDDPAKIAEQAALDAALLTVTPVAAKISDVKPDARPAFGTGGASSSVVAGPIGAASAGNGVLDKAPRFSKDAAPAASAAAGAAPAAANPPVFQVDNTAPTLNPMASALSARTVLTAGVAPQGTPTAGQVPHPSTQQIIVALQKSSITKDTQLSLQLNPAELGRVDVKITIDQNGKAVAQIMADRPETLALLQKDSSHLEKALQAAGLNNSAQDLHYSLREQNGQRNNGQEFSGRRRRALFDGDDDIRGVTLEAPVANDGLPHRVNYHA